MLQKLPVNDFIWVEEASQFNEDFIKSYNEDSDERYFLEGDVLYPDELRDLQNNLSFLRERMKIEKVEKITCIIKRNMLFTSEIKKKH